MENGARFVNVKNKEGKVILSISLQPGTGIILDDKPPVQANHSGSKEAKGKPGNGNSNKSDTLMTFPQKRLLFRLLADQGIEGDQAHEHLKKLFQSSSLKEVTKNEASRVIERLLNEAKGGSHDGVPF